MTSVLLILFFASVATNIWQAISGVRHIRTMDDLYTKSTEMHKRHKEELHKQTEMWRDAYLREKYKHTVNMEKKNYIQ